MDGPGGEHWEQDRDWNPDPETYHERLMAERDFRDEHGPPLGDEPGDELAYGPDEEYPR
jgi:hypothetical protein